MSTNSSKQHKTSIKTFQQKMRKLNMALLVLEAMTPIIESYRRGYEVRPNFSRFVNDDLKEVVWNIIMGQNLLGQTEFMKGFLTHQWDMVQNIYLNSKDINSDRTIWAAGITPAIWNYSKSMWKARNDYVRKTKKNEKTRIIRIITKRNRSNLAF